jgi:hypothetical protein
MSVNRSSGVSGTPIQQAITLVIGSYQAACAKLTQAERDVLRDVIAARLAHDYLADVGKLTELPAEGVPSASEPAA